MWFLYLLKIVWDAFLKPFRRLFSMRRFRQKRGLRRSIDLLEVHPDSHEPLKEIAYYIVATTGNSVLANSYVNLLATRTVRVGESDFRPLNELELNTELHFLKTLERDSLIDTLNRYLRFRSADQRRTYRQISEIRIALADNIELEEVIKLLTALRNLHSVACGELPILQVISIGERAFSIYSD